MSEEKVVSLLRQDLLIFVVGGLLFALGLFQMVGDVFVLVFAFAGIGMMGFVGADALRLMVKLNQKSYTDSDTIDVVCVG